ERSPVSRPGTNVLGRPAPPPPAGHLGLASRHRPQRCLRAIKRSANPPIAPVGTTLNGPKARGSRSRGQLTVPSHAGAGVRGGECQNLEVRRRSSGSVGLPEVHPVRPAPVVAGQG